MDEIDVIVGMHVENWLPIGTIGVCKGASMASSRSFRLDFHGKTAHATLPQSGVDAISAAVRTYNNIQFMLSREINPFAKYVCSIGKLCGGTSQNIVKDLGLLRIKATVIGLIIGLIFLTVSIKLGISASTSFQRFIPEFFVLLVAIFSSLVVADIFKCENLCGIAAIITVICVVSSLGMTPYLYAIMRVLQTLIGVGAAFLINRFVANPNNKAKKK